MLPTQATTTARRPHVPSKPALRVLYQLAYISSGAALGIATLCAEERRRRTKVLQRIADNAKLIRQSPRYYSAGAQVVARGEEDGEWWTKLGEVEAGAGVGGNGKREGAIKGPELPSVVEQEFEELDRRDYKRVRRRSGGRVGDGVERGASASRKAPAAALHATRRPGAASIAREERVKDNHDTEVRQRTSIRSHGSEDGAGQSLVRGYRTRSFWRSGALHGGHDKPGMEIQNPSSDAINQDVSVFLRQKKHEKSGHVAANLLELALHHGSANWSESMLAFYLMNAENDGTIADRDFHDVVRYTMSTALAQSASRTEEEFNRLLDIIFASQKFARFSELRRVKLLIQAGSEAASRAVSCEAFRRALNDVDVGMLDASVETTCRRLVLNGKVARATDLAINIHERTLLSGHVLDDVFTAALTQRNASCAWRVLSCKQRRGQANMTEWDDMLELCQKTGAHDMLSKDIERKSATGAEWDTIIAFCSRIEAQDLLVKIIAHAYDIGPAHRRKKAAHGVFPAGELRQESYVVLARACITAEPMIDKRIFIDIFRRLPHSMRDTVIDSSSAAITRELSAVWTSTRNFTTALNLSRNRINQLRARGSEEAVVKVRVALVDLLLSAGKVAPAQRLLSVLHAGKRADRHVGGLAAVSFARKKDWASLERLFEIMQREGRLLSSPDLRRHFNRVLCLYASEHSADELLVLSTRLTTKLGFKADMATNTIMLQAFAKSQRLDLINAWSANVRQTSPGLQSSSRTAAEVLKAYYLQHRPSHVLVMWYCRNLANASPLLAGDGSEYVQLVREAIAYDMRKARGRDVTWKREKARQRLDLLGETKETGIIPNPGYRVDKRIVFPQMDNHREEILSKGVAVEPRQGLDQHSASHSVFEESRQNLSAEDFIEHPVGSGIDEKTPRMPAEREEARIDSRSFQGVDEGYSSADSTKSGLEYGVGMLDDIRRDGFDPTQLGLESEDGIDFDLPTFAEFSEVRDANGLQPKGLDRDVTHRERDMILALSASDNAAALSVYEQMLDAVGLPATPLALEVAVEASLRLHKGDSSHAEEIMQRAHDAGFNVTCAMAPLLIHKMYHTRELTQEGLGKMINMTSEYYRVNEENGWPTRHHVAVTAANILINRHRPLEGLKLLSNISSSQWVKDKAMPIEALTVYIKGYTVVGKIDGVKWAVSTVLDSDMRIDTIFLTTLKLCVKRISADKRMPTPDSKLLSLLDHLYDKCRAKYRKQRIESKKFGRQLVGSLVYWAKRDDRLSEQLPSSTTTNQDLLAKPVN
ncbi:hypothetical protein MBLNU230_g7907t1 [Neophaeotheca triangularis]